MQLKNGFLTDVAFNIELHSRKINVPEHQQESGLDLFIVLAHISLLPIYFLYTISEYEFSLHVVLNYLKKKSYLGVNKIDYIKFTLFLTLFPLFFLN